MNGTLRLLENKTWAVERMDGKRLPVLPASMLGMTCNANDEVLYVIHEVWEDSECDTQVTKYAKLMSSIDLDNLQTYPDGEHEQWDSIHEEYSNEQWPPFGGPFNDSMTFNDWLKLNFNPPTRKKNANI
jgi:hypothetical protein